SRHSDSFPSTQEPVPSPLVLHTMAAEGRTQSFCRVPVESEEKPEPAVPKKCCAPNLKIFIGILAMSYFSKSMSASYMKSTITQIERRFEIPSSIVGIIDCSFEMGNLLVITLVSYFGAKFHRPKIIGAGSLLMALGTIIMATPHFFMERYKYESVAQFSQEGAPENMSMGSPCSPSLPNTPQEPGCEDGGEVGSSMWIVVLLGNMLRGIGEAAIGPLGVSFIDDNARPENSAFYIGCLHTIAVIGPLFGFSLGSLCARLYVDVGFVNTDSLTITTQDSRWVGAWWLGFLVAGTFNLVTSLPYWVLPQALPEDGEPKQQLSNPAMNCHSFLKIAKEFLPSLKRVLTNKVFVFYLLGNILMFNSFVIIITYTPKYFEQQFGQSASTANFLIGVTCMPAVSLGIFFSGIIMKHFKLDLLGAAKVAFVAAVGGLLCMMPFFLLSCRNTDIAGLTAPYPGHDQLDPHVDGPLSSCNAACRCPEQQWDPVCGPQGITYISPCFAGCSGTTGFGKNMTFHGCTCVSSPDPGAQGPPVTLGQCPREEKCSTMFYIYLALQSSAFFIYSLGSTPLVIICLRSVEPELKSLSVGLFMLSLRVLGGIPAPIYFGALIDSTCLKWGTRKCGGQGACRMYKIQTFRFLFLGMITCLRLAGYVFLWVAIIQIKKRMKQQKKDELPSKEFELQLSLPESQKQNSNGSLNVDSKDVTLE
ncbi:solute carrier organic anion transporter family member 1C1-like, partial [Arapaima gigas]